MKKIIKNFMYLITGVAMFAFTSCSKDDDNGDVITITDGIYIYGSKTVATEAGVADGKFELANLDKDKGLKVTQKSGIYAKYVYIGANSTINFADCSDKGKILYGGTIDVAKDSAQKIEKSADQVKCKIIYGALSTTAAPISISTEGLYYICVNTLKKTFTMFRVVEAGIIGAATPNGWSGSTALAQKSVSKDVCVFEATGVTLVGGDYKFRMNNGWNFFAGDSIVTHVNVGLPATGDILTEGAGNITFPAADKGKWTVTLTYTRGKGWTKSFSGKVAIANTDFSNQTLYMIGNAFAVDTITKLPVADPTLKIAKNSDWSRPGLGTNAGAPKAVKSGDVYTWTWSNVKLLATKELKFREELAGWGGLSVGFTGNTIAGDTGNFTDNGGNIKVTADQVYKTIELKIDAANNDTKTITFTK